MNRLNLTNTRQLHQRLQKAWEKDPANCRAMLASIHRKLAGQDIRFERSTPIKTALSALILSQEDSRKLRTLAETLHEIVELAIDWVTSSRERLDRIFPSHSRMTRFLSRTRGSSTWQGYARYDAVITESGHVKFIELNTGCPAGFLHAEAVSQVVLEALDDLLFLREAGTFECGTIPARALVDALVEIEMRADVPLGTVCLVNDENHLVNELELIKNEFASRGRDTAIVNASEFSTHDNALFYNGQRVSMTFNKIRISTESSPGWHWKSGFEQRYDAFLRACTSQKVVAVNNLCALTIGEDKELLSLLANPEFQPILTDKQRRFVYEHVAWTAPLNGDCALKNGIMHDMQTLLRKEKNKLVVKPSNEGRGFGVVIGCECTDVQWQEYCRPRGDLPQVVQEFVQPVSLPAIRSDAADVAVRDNYVTLGLAIAEGRYLGTFSRMSPALVTNVAQGGVPQAVLVKSS